MSHQEEKYIRNAQTSATCFVYCGDEYLFLKRHPGKRVNPGKLNGVGGRVDPGEDYLSAAIREVEEETGYKVNPSDTKFCGVIIFEGGYDEDWVACFFKMEVKDKTIPIGNTTPDGELLWIHKDEVLQYGDELVDDIHYCFKEIVEEKEVFFMNVKSDDNEKIYEASIKKLTQ